MTSINFSTKSFDHGPIYTLSAVGLVLRLYELVFLFASLVVVLALMSSLESVIVDIFISFVLMLVSELLGVVLLLTSPLLFIVVFVLAGGVISGSVLVLIFGWCLCVLVWVSVFILLGVVEFVLLLIWVLSAIFPPVLVLMFVQGLT
eukprot:TRINITY_DN11765_c7_g1_i1.p1 TRINITY_DN11765_c7_g1~~TRINITY_DN11765_c7_g1_i1.p1  ORF type:complete len:147 (-),score=18.81 TRINITY_DN11765_c7_g1_i1:7-447(-)